MIVSALVVAAGSLAVGLVIALGLRTLPTVRLQLMGLGLLAAGVPLAAVLLSGWVMFHMGDDVKILAVAVASASSALFAALFLARSIADSLDRVRQATAALAAGDLAARAPEARTAELTELARSFNEMAANLERLFDARRELVAWASHDLRAPLTNIQSMLEAIDDGLATPGEYLTAIRDQVRSLTVLVDDLFELAQLDQGALTLELRDAELEGVVAACLRGIEAEARARNVDIRAHIARDAAAHCAPEKVERVLFNLLTNALRHTPSDGAIAVFVQPEEHEVRVSVEDSGAGLSNDAIGRMFDRFWRDDPARSSPGSGLGLTIARGLVEAHGGRIWAENRASGGARVSFTLPTA
jgi:signal transduction histidine kinase